MKHQINRVRHELQRRSLVVKAVEHVTPNMLRLTLGGEELSGFTSLAPDDHIKVFASEGEGEGTAMRDYTPRRYDAETNELTVDFALHEAGPVTAWASGVKVGDEARIGGPRGSLVVPQDFDWWLLVGDETALPAIGRRIEELAPGTPVTSIVAVTGADEEQTFQTEANHEAIWVHRAAAQAGEAEPLLAALRRFVPPSGDGFIFIAAEGGVTRVLRSYVLEELGHVPQWLKASGYWVKGAADTTEKFES
ncbi:MULTISPECIES: siderophore-interacting protein [Novosphingobium]|uniref:Siderophore-interacting protein n=1 Tax=Novosphingobium pentaromativorans TaxID=205844 RepID=A0A2W5NEG1_9SPHN|nr:MULTISPECIES: siderophore-interacting protein [Novosphingobium]PZQ51871.1 MAG: siderophore-interacting protein [Novosphingobium pentaromativorans]GFE76858.1 siderophore-interacting protein [Novosphingobium sp. TCA1]